ncbi:ASCH domain-containing protein [Brachybacterium phenoliresistens]|uniref:RNA-binding protein n=1 Tax=Brachybacterium phenoliresistens TaxID=396014 RepID=Z9JTJ6_9MICO|nr:ASCH domain-containing protein [Brachybacterium phenoliresistens]EWS81700.1 RNA-binding protein [Brachybacterium phenoliresistens]
MSSDDLTSFWADARAVHPSLPEELPPAWAFGATPEHADGLLALVLAGTKTGTAGALWDYEAEGEKVPEVGDLSIILDGAGAPRAVLEVTEVRTVPFDQVSEEHAHSEGEGDRSLADWRRIHEAFWRDYGTRGFRPDMPIVCERFRVIHGRPAQDCHSS